MNCRFIDIMVFYSNYKLSICLVFCYCYERLLENNYCFRLLLNIGFVTHSIFIKLIKDISVEILKYGKDFYMYFLFYLYDMLFFIRWNFICVQERIL